ncbi:type II and III secretion system protein family protein [Rhizobium alvei]|uniref:Type II and III secretion system protein family protein n=1 Tax=Rhizobium alvei TaxID=1132659 RepID=A0ABT8YR43_9HYPH|nr:type II and III secretion system protein family protein [Rhizobium alvei]MDO6966211.1 type II and III secretion system protein family protein [Rhizobium alvei]
MISKSSFLVPARLILGSALALAGVPGTGEYGWSVPAAEAANASIIKISQVGPGVSKKLKLGLSKAIVLDLPEDAHDILVANPEIADAVTRTSRRLYLFGKAVGQTNVFIFGPGGEELVSIDLEIERDISNLEAQLKRFIPESDIKVEIISDNIVLSGSVRTPQDASQAEKLAEIFVKGGEATTRNVSATSTTATGDASVALFNEDRQTSQIVNMLTIEAEDQVTLKVTVAEVSRQVLKQLGFSGSIKGASGAISFTNPTNLGGSNNWVTGNALSGTLGKFDISTYVNAMEQAGVMRTLAEPSLTAISGEQAKFKVGGEFRLVSNQEISEDGITRESESVEYGIELNFKPIVLSPGRISLNIETNVSEPTFEGSYVSGGTKSTPAITYLGIRKREASTTVELPSGGSIVIAGLVRDEVRQASSGIPALARVPILGSLFRSKDFQRNETELVIIATPYLVRPVERSKLARPDDNFNPESDVATFFLNRVNKIYGRRENAKNPGQYNGAVGFIYK